MAAARSCQTPFSPDFQKNSRLLSLTLSSFFAPAKYRDCNPIPQGLACVFPNIWGYGGPRPLDIPPIKAVPNLFAAAWSLSRPKRPVFCIVEAGLLGVL